MYLLLDILLAADAMFTFVERVVKEFTHTLFNLRGF